LEGVFKDYFKMNLGKLSLRVYEYLTFNFGSSKELKSKKKQIKFGIRKLEKEIDIVYIVRKLQEVEKLKMLLLNSN
jgi:hypothetical protein